MQAAAPAHLSSTPSPPAQPVVKTAYAATALAVFIESFYRSAMNNLINARLDGRPAGPPASWFPSMHVQAPTRVFYIMGLKEIRRRAAGVDTPAVAARAGVSDNACRLALAFLPGVVMCPVSSVLEATHARANKEPLATKWMRGYSPRLVREIIFGVGINQLTDLCLAGVPERVGTPHLRVALGSIAAGLASGYLSQIPHNLGTLKMLDPSRSYGELWRSIWQRSVPRLPAAVAAGPMRVVAAQCLAVLAPLGCVRRSCQIGGSFVIINGLLYALRDKAWP